MRDTKYEEEEEYIFLKYHILPSPFFKIIFFPPSKYPIDFVECVYFPP